MQAQNFQFLIIYIVVRVQRRRGGGKSRRSVRDYAIVVTAAIVVVILVHVRRTRPGRSRYRTHSLLYSLFKMLCCLRKESARI